MKNKTFKKSISLIMAVLMVLSAWVFFVSPVEAEAATANLDGINSTNLNTTVDVSFHGSFANDGSRVSTTDYAETYKNVLWATQGVNDYTAKQTVMYAGSANAGNCSVDDYWYNPTTVFLYDGVNTMQTAAMYMFDANQGGEWDTDHHIYTSYLANSDLSFGNTYWKGYVTNSRNYQFLYFATSNIKYINAFFVGNNYSEFTANATADSTKYAQHFTDDDGWNKFYANSIICNATMSNSEYTRKITPTFAAAHSLDGDRAGSYKIGSVNSSAPIYLINYVPLKNAINEAITAYNSYKTEIANYPNRYTAESINAFVAAVNGLIEAKPNNYSYSSGAEAAVNSYASKAKAAVDAWNAAKTLKRITPDVNYDNLFSLSEWAYSTPNPGNGTIEVNNTNGSFVINSNASGGECYTPEFTIVVEPNTTYTFGWTATTTGYGNVTAESVTTDVYLFRNGVITDIGTDGDAEQNRGTLAGGTNKEKTFNFTTHSDTTYVTMRFDCNGNAGTTATFSNIWFAKKEYADKYNLKDRTKYRDLITATSFWQPTRENYTFVRWCDAEDLWSWKSAPNSYTTSTTLYSDWDAVNDINYDNYFSFSEWASSDCAKVVANNKESSIDVDIPNGQFTFTPTVGYENLRLGSDNNSYYHMTLEKGEKYILQYDVSTSTGYVAIKYNDATKGLTDCPDENGVEKKAYIWGGGAAGSRTIAFTAPSESIWINFGTTVEDTSSLTPITFSNITVYKMSDEDKILSMGDSYEVRDLVTVGSDLSSPSRPGFSFGGWYTDRNFTSQVTNASALGNSTTVFSKWNAIDVNYDNLFSLAGWGNSLSSKMNPANGSVSFDTVNGTITYTPNAAWATTYMGFASAGYYGMQLEAGETYILRYDAEQTGNAQDRVYLYGNDTSEMYTEYKRLSGQDIEFVAPSDGYVHMAVGSCALGGAIVFSNIRVHKAAKKDVLESITNREYRINTPMSGADLYTPERVGYTFLGWFYDEDCTDAVEDTDTFTANTTVYSDWTINKYTVKFVNAAGKEVSSAEYDYGTAASAITKPANTAMTKDADKHYSYSWPTIGDVTGDVTYNEVVTSADHTWNSGTVTTNPTCEGAGIKTYTCSTCQATKTESVAATGHSYDSGVITTKPTCEGAGVKTFTCSKCGDTYTEAVAATGHTEEAIPAVAATCTTAGSTAGVKCSVCQAIITAPTTTAKLGHAWDAGKITTEPKCGVKGEKTFNCTRCSETKTEEIAALEHTGGEANCQKGAICERCGVEYTAVNSKNHGEYLKKVSAKAATCTEDGNIQHWYCSACDGYFTDDAGTEEIEESETIIVKLGHTPGAEATCLTAQICTICDAELVAAKGHTFGEVVPQVDSTCSATGNYAYKQCTVCQLYFDGSAAVDAEHSYDSPSASGLVIPKKSHTYNDPSEEDVVWTINDEKVPTVATLTLTCTKCSEKQTYEAYYDFWDIVELTNESTAGTCVSPSTKKYEATFYTSPKFYAYKIIEGEIDASEHTSLEKIDAQEATCETAGNIQHWYCSACDGYFTDDAGTVATTSEKVIIAALGHSYTVVVDNKNGTHHYKCSRCDETNNAGDCDYSEIVDEKAPTCTEKGYKTYKCSVCSSGKTDIIDMIPHTAGATVVENKVDATCTATGSYDNVVYCTECNAEISRETITTDMIAHDYKAVVTAPTCTEKGYTTYTCSRCTDSYVDDYVDALGHTWNSGEITTKPTCTEKGVKTYTCTFEGCGATYTEEVDALGHDKVPHEAKAPTCTEIGWYAYDTCSRCDYTTYKEIEPLGHIDENPVDGYCDREGCHADICKHPGYNLKVDEPTCTQDGMAHKVCKICKAELSTTVIPAKGHSEVVTEVGATCQEYAHNLVTCANCDGLNEKVYTGNYFAPHSWVIIPGKAPTCTSEGYSDYSRCMTCATIEESSKIPVVPHTDSDNNEVCDTCGGKYISSSKACGCICHNDNFIMVILYKIAHFFWKLFKINKSCNCGTVHY